VKAEIYLGAVAPLMQSTVNTSGIRECNEYALTQVHIDRGNRAYCSWYMKVGCHRTSACGLCFDKYLFRLVKKPNSTYHGKIGKP
jgi:hypothetical protein